MSAQRNRPFCVLVTKNHFYNPVKQSLAHSIAIKILLSQWSALKIIPIVVFTGGAILKDVDSSYNVIYDFDLIKTIQAYRTIYLSDSDVQKVVDILLQNDVSEFVDNNAHVSNIYAYRAEMNNKVASGICPKCGGALVKRIGRYGSFYGCSNYPKCRFTAK